MSFFNTSGNSEFIKLLLNCYVNVLKFFVSLVGMLLTWHVFLISGKKMHSLYMYWMFIFCNSIKGGTVWSKLRQVLIVSFSEKNIFFVCMKPNKLYNCLSSFFLFFLLVFFPWKLRQISIVSFLEKKIFCVYQKRNKLYNCLSSFFFFFFFSFFFLQNWDKSWYILSW